MKTKPFKLFVGCLLAIILPMLALGGSLTYSPLVPQTGDSDLIINHKAAVAHCNLAAGNSYANITTSTTTVVKASPGVLDRVVINTVGTTGSITIYDNASAGSGTKIATADSTALSGTTLSYNVAAANGITIVTTGAPNITVSYR